MKLSFIKALCLFFAMTGANVYAGSAGEATKPNIVFFLVDDLGWADVGCNGSSFYDTPNIDALAEEGVRFTNAYAACHVCSPTRASILTGKYPASINLTDWLPGRPDASYQELLNARIYQHLPYSETTIAEVLKDVGYSTGIIGKWHLGEDPSDPMAHGFDMHIPDWHSNPGRMGFHQPHLFKGLEDSKEGDYLVDRLADKAVEYIEENKDNPFFLYMAHYAVHDPIEGRKDLVEKYKKKLASMPPDDGPDFILEGNPDNPNNPTRKELDKLMKKSEYADTYRAGYPNDLVKIKQKQDNVEFAAMVEAVDQSLGRILAKLEELELAENTIIIFFADNGGMSAANGTPWRVFEEDQLDEIYSTSNLPLRGAKGWLYEGGIREPMIVKWPGQSEAGTECHEPVISIDFYPTLLEMIGEGNRITADKEGKSLVPLVKGEAMERGPIYWHFPHYGNHGMQSPGGAIREGDYKLLDYFENGTVQLFNLTEDMGEQHDLSKIEVEKTRELKAKLDQWRKDIGAQMMKANPDYDPSADPFKTNIYKKIDKIHTYE